MNLDKEIEKKKSEIKTDGYPMSIGELISLYQSGDLTIFPEYQRYFRWNLTQKSQLIESIILGIPIPAIFVSQDEKGMWDVIDGLQRLCTIFEFVGILKDKSGELYEPSKLLGTKFLPSLEGKTWSETDNIGEANQRIIKRSKLNLMIIDSTTDSTAKYELFQRLNTNGAELTAQEVRNCLLVMLNKEFFEKLEDVSKKEYVVNTMNLTERQLEEQYDKELITRLIVSRNINLGNVNSTNDIEPYVTEKIVELVQEDDVNLLEDIRIIDEMFEFLDKLLGENTFKKFNKESGKHEGSFYLSLYEVLTVGISKNLEFIKNMNQSELKEKIQKITYDDTFLEYSKRGTRPILRYKNLQKLSLEIFKNES